MPEVVLTLGQNGRPMGVTDLDNAQYRAFRKHVQEMKPGQTMAFSWSVPRSPKVHAAYFAILGTIFKNQERFTCQAEFRDWVERGARHVEIFSLGDVKFERVKSVRYDDLDDDEFQALFSRAKAFLLSAEALGYLWPHPSISTSYEAAKLIIEGDGN